MPLQPYTGAWDKPQLLHLLRRTLFGVQKSDLTTFANMSMNNVVASLLTANAVPSTVPLVDYTGDTIAIGDTWVNGPVNGTYSFARGQSLRAWWSGLMLNQSANILEKMVLFWHNHIPTDIGTVVTEPIYAYRYNVLLRRNALGNFKTMVREMTIEPAMLIYLNGRQNTRTAPNENYARELQELFTVGKDLPAYYTEGDVKAAARALTGWIVDGTTLSSRFDKTRHDTTNKVFSSFYNNTTIVGRSDDNAGLTELDDLLNMIFANSEVAKYVVRKIYRFFVYYNITPDIETNVITPLADIFRTGGVRGQPYDIKPVLEALLTSQHFYDAMTSKACHIKNPVDYCIGLARTFNVSATGSDLVNTYKNLRFFFDEGLNMQMRPGNPPNVAGWPAYYQTPSYHELWINADTLRRRKEHNDKILINGSNGMRANLLAFTAALSNPFDPNELINEVLELLHPVPSDDALKTQLKSILLSGQALDHYWTDAWASYVSSPTTANTNIVLSRLRTFYQAVTNMAENHLI